MHAEKGESGMEMEKEGGKGRYMYIRIVTVVPFVLGKAHLPPHWRKRRPGS